MTEAAYKLDAGEPLDLGTAFMTEYIPKYWHFVDRNNDGLLNYEEFKMAWSDISAILVQVSFQCPLIYKTLLAANS